MKIIQYYFTVLLIFVLHASAFAQCDVDAGKNQAIPYNGSAQLNATVAEANWKALNSGSTVTLNAVFFTSSEVGYTVGTFGTILKTTDGGEIWEPQTSGTPNTLLSVYFTSPQTGFAVGMNGTILKTYNGGDNWMVQTSGTTAHLRSICFTSENMAYITGNTGSLTTLSGIVLASTDGGETWAQKANIPGNQFYAIHFSSENTAYVAGVYDAIYKSTNKGLNWTKQTTGDVIGSKQTSYNTIQFTSAETGYIGGTNGKILKTTNGGGYWQNCIRTTIFTGKDSSSLNPGRDISNVTFKSICTVSADTIYAVGSGPDFSIIIKTTDGGINWYEQSVIPGTKVKLFSIHFPDAKTGYAAGVLGNIYKLSNSDSYSWSPSTGLSATDIPNPLASPQETTTYVVTHANFYCTTTDTLTVYVEPHDGKFKTITCGESVLIDNVASNYTGAGTLSYKWVPSTGLNNDSFEHPVSSATVDTRYIVSITLPDNTVTKDSVDIFVRSINVNAGADKTIICGDSVQFDPITTNFTGSGTLKYKWFPSAGLNNDSIAQPIAAPTTDMTYTVKVITPGGCSATDRLTVYARQFVVDNARISKNMTCSGNVQFEEIKTNYTGSGSLKYKWSPSAGLDNDTIANPICDIRQNTNYTVSITTPNGCTASANVFVSVMSIYVNAGNNKSVSCGDSVQLDVPTINYSGTGKLLYKWTPATGLSNDTIANPKCSIGSDMIYSVEITTPDGCAGSGAVKVTYIQKEQPEISYVGVNENNKNVIVWNKQDYAGVQTINIYKETNVTDAYSKIGSVRFDSVEMFVDTLSSPNVQSNKYKMSIFDECGYESGLSNHHKTMHLSINKGISNSWNLIWESYIGYTVSTYNIFRGTTAGNIQLIGSLSGSNNQFSDFTAHAGSVYYQIEALNANMASAQSTGALKMKSTLSPNYSRSNIASYEDKTAINELKDISDMISISPNPCTDKMVLNVGEITNQKFTLMIFNVLGSVVKSEKVTDGKQTVDLSHLSNGVYMLVVQSDNFTGKQKLIIQK